MEGSGENLGEIKGSLSIMKFTLPSIVTMLFISSYSLVDGAFISNLVGSDALASVNILMPAMSLLSGIGFMLSTGGSAYVANLMGKGRQEEAEGAFTTIMLTAAVISLAFMAVGMAFVGPLVELLGSGEALYDGSVEYAWGFLPFIVFLTGQFLVTQFLIVAGRPGMSLLLSVAGGLTNIVLDYVLIALMDMGLTGAAIASGTGSLVPAAAGALFFVKGKGTLHFRRPSGGLHAVASSCLNGISEMASELSGGVTILCYNMVMMSFIGPDGVAAITVMSYVQFLALAVVIGYSNGIAPVMSFNHGAGDKDGMQGLMRFSLFFVAAFSIAVFVVMELFAANIAGFFVSGYDNVMDVAVIGARIFSIGFLFMGFNVYFSSLFTSLSNGPVSALISLIRSLLLLAPLILVLPYMFGIEAVWFATPLTELVTLAVAIGLVLKLKGRYGYLA
jgi:Na+-driven multidrug efflux pump